MKSNMYQQVYISFASGKILLTLTSNLVIIIAPQCIKAGHYFMAAGRIGGRPERTKAFLIVRV